MRTEDVEVDRARRRIAARACRHLMHHDGGFGYAQIGAAKFFRHGDAQPSGIGHRLVEFGWERLLIFAAGPIIVPELVAHLPHTVADGFLVL